MDRLGLKETGGTDPSTVVLLRWLPCHRRYGEINSFRLNCAAATAYHALDIVHATQLCLFQLDRIRLHVYISSTKCSAYVECAGHLNVLDENPF